MNETEMINLTIDGNAIQVPKGTTVYQAAKQLGIELPIFCYQDRMPPFGACRVCMVEVEKMAKPQTSCTLVATEGMIVKTQSEMAVDSRRGIIEFLLINHPLDCPICDRGGECPLQDNTMKYGPGKSQFCEEKRHFKKAYPLGPVLELDRERCIVCARCTRFGENIAGDTALQFIERGYKTEVGTPDGQAPNSKFIGNTILICPVGALTSRVYRFRARPWDNTPTASSCTLCPVGCSLYLDSRDGEIVRTRSKENKSVNDIWMCDKGWFGYEFTSNQQERLQRPLIKKEGKFVPSTWDEALSLIVSKMKFSKARGEVAAFGGNPLTLEENYFFQKLIREGAGVNNLDHRIGVPLFDLQTEGLSPGMEMSIGECEDLSYIILVGIDLTEEFPVIWLRMRQAINKGAKVFFLGHYEPEIAKYFTKVFTHTPGLELEQLNKHSSEFSALAQEGKKGAIFVGKQYLDSPRRKKILSELLRLKNTYSQLSLNILEGRGNSMGARYAGMRPDLGPFEERLIHPGMNALQVLETASKKGWDFLYVAGANPAVKYPSKLWREARNKIKFLIVQDLFLTETAQEADVVLPTLSYVEKCGTFINIEGRIQMLMPGKAIPDSLFSDAEIFMELGNRLNLEMDLDKRLMNMREKIPLVRPSHIEMMEDNLEEKKEEREWKATFAYSLFDHGVRMQHDPHLIHLAKEPRVRMNKEEGLRKGFEEGEEIKLRSNEGVIRAKLRFDQNVADETVVVPLGYPEMGVHNLGGSLLNGMNLVIEKTK